MVEDWRQVIATERMAVDDDFDDRLEDASLDRQQWDLVMTAVTFEIVSADDPQAATVVPNTEKLDGVIAELEANGPALAVAPGGRAAPAGGSSVAGVGGVLANLKQRLGIGNSRDGRREEIQRLVEEYAGRLEDKLRADDRWDEVRRHATD